MTGSTTFPPSSKYERTLHHHSPLPHIKQFTAVYFHSSSHNLDRPDFVQTCFGGPPTSSLFIPLIRSSSSPYTHFAHTRTHTTHLPLCTSNSGPDAFDNHSLPHFGFFGIPALRYFSRLYHNRVGRPASPSVHLSIRVCPLTPLL